MTTTSTRITSVNQLGDNENAAPTLFNLLPQHPLQTQSANGSAVPPNGDKPGTFVCQVTNLLPMPTYTTPYSLLPSIGTASIGTAFSLYQPNLEADSFAPTLQWQQQHKLVQQQFYATAVDVVQQSFGPPLTPQVTTAHAVSVFSFFENLQDSNTLVLEFAFRNEQGKRSNLKLCCQKLMYFRAYSKKFFSGMR